MRLAPDTGWTYTRMLAELPEGSLFELYGGQLIPISPAPTPFHQDIVGNLYFIFRSYLQQRNIGKAFVSPLDVVLSEKVVIDPDVFVILSEVQYTLNGRIGQAPDLVVEVLSPRSIRRDQIEKRQIYADFGVKEYWLVDPANRYVEVNTLINGRYDAHATASDIEGEELSSEVSSALLPELVVTCREIFA